MKILKYIFLPIVFLLLLAFSSDTKNNYIEKIKILTQVIRIVNENYVDDLDMNEVLDGAIIGLLGSLDPHSTYFPPKEKDDFYEKMSGEFEGIGIEFSMIDGYITIISPIPETPSDRAGLLSGDKIVKIDGESAYKITQNDVFKKLRGPKGSKVIVTIRRNNSEDFDVTLVRAKIPINSLLANFMIDDKTGYIKLQRFMNTSYDEVKEAINELEKSGMQQLMIDLRNNPGGLMGQAIELVDMFIDSNDTIVFTKGRNHQSTIARASSSYRDKKYPLVVLINRGSASASEIVSGAFQDLDRAIIVGETSFGKGSVQNVFPSYGFKDGSAIKLTVAKYYISSGRSIHREDDEGLDEYYLDLAKDNREKNDSLLVDKPIFYTKKGRIVYGDGGITPDFYVKADLELSNSVTEFLIHPDRLLFNFADDIKNSMNNTELNTFQTVDQFINDYSISNDDKKNLINILKDLDDEFADEDFEKDWNYLENRIKAQIANAIWDKSAMYKVNLHLDVVAQEGLKQFSEAQLLIE